ncbi:hypothetical protein LCGC14_1670110 [marine sediment metagenome]|uniref:Uncharacterized protein n=1 Tax=marine sediment metagenome TaxID=412755 RepID=A0A0F9K7H8_9ZZZZ
MDEAGREKTLREWCDRLPDDHRVNIEFNKLRETIGLLNSMILSGEQHSETSEKVVAEAVNILKGKV